MISIKKKIKEYYLFIKKRFFSWKGFCILSVILTIQILSNHTSNILKEFLNVSHNIPLDSYLLQGSIYFCRFIFFLLQAFIIYEFNKKKDNDYIKHMHYKTAIFYLNESNKHKVNIAEWKEWKQSYIKFSTASLSKDYDKEDLFEQSKALKEFISIDSKIKLKLIS